MDLGDGASRARAKDRRPAYVAAFLLFLVTPQAVALALQFHRGFRPFVHPPSRVALSWDMFAIEISRCDLRWNPPLDVVGHPLPSLRSAGQPLEWDPVFNNVEQYAAAGRYGCDYARPNTPTRVSLTCATAEGQIVRDDFPCH